MIAEFIIGMTFGQKILAYAFLLIGLYIFVKTGKIRIFNRPVIPMKWRITLALFFPILFILGLVFGAIILGIAFTMIAVAVLISIFTGRKLKRPKFPKIRINVIKK